MYTSPYAQVGCGPEKQCVWLPMPHYSQPWCSGVDFVYDIDYRSLLAKGEVQPTRDVGSAPIDALHLAADAGASTTEVVKVAPPHGAESGDKRVLLLQGGDQGGEPLSWLPLADFKSKQWKGPFAQRVQRALQATMHLSGAQLDIVKDCMHSLATSHD